MDLADLIDTARKRPAFSLEQPFYCDPALFKADLASVFGNQWLLAGHVSQIPETGDFFLFELGGESIIVVREDENRINAFFNVCRHRGSRICLEAAGRKRLLVCPYHAWSYALDGRLKSARLMPDEFDANNFGLHPCHIQLFEGLIFLNLEPDAPADLESLYSAYRPLAVQQGLTRARVANRRCYPTQANWKLVVENFIECYHCVPAHPEYCSVHSKLKILARGAGDGSGPSDADAQFAPEFDAWVEQSEALGHLTEEAPGGSDEIGEFSASRTLINQGFKTETLDGEPACSRLMGTYQDYDGGVTYLVFNFFSVVFGMNDFAVLVQFVPRDVGNTDVWFTWLVDKDAQPGRDYDAEEITRFWDITTKQDKRIAQDNQAGVNSSRYEPGPYSIQEKNLPRFKQWYLDQLAKQTKPLK